MGTSDESESLWIQQLADRLRLGKKPSHGDLVKLKHLAEAENIDAMLAYGTWQVFGSYDVKVDIAYGLRLIDKAAKAGSVDALNWMGIACEDGRFMEPDVGKAVNFYVCAALLGNKDAIYNIARFMDEGSWLERDVELARLIFDKASESNS